jgi:uncharacterized OB-fold protein
VTATTATPVVPGWFTTGPAPALLGSRCTTCGTLSFPPSSSPSSSPSSGPCPRPDCAGDESASVELSRRGRVWSYTDAQYQPPPPYVPASEPYRPFALAAVELPEGLVVLGQLAEGFGVDDVVVGSEVELVVETLYVDAEGDRSIWRWRPVGSASAPAEGGR